MGNMIACLMRDLDWEGYKERSRLVNARRAEIDQKLADIYRETSKEEIDAVLRNPAAAVNRFLDEQKVRHAAAKQARDDQLRKLQTSYVRKWKVDRGPDGKITGFSADE
jgi:hypothetical protein